MTASVLPLGRASDSAPTTVYVDEGGLLFGDAAERRGASRPDRMVREFKRRIGDDIPIVAADRRFAPEELYASVVGWVVGLATEREGRHPAGITLTVPVSWGEYRSGLVLDALNRQGWSDVTLISEPEAAARHYEATHPLPDGGVLAVYDLGGGTFDAVVLQKSGEHVDVVGRPAGLPHLGGADFDDAVLRHVVATAGLAPATLAGTPNGRMTLAALRRECVEAKESLSFDSEATVAVLVDGEHTAVRVTRSELEDMIDADIAQTVDALANALEDAHVHRDDVEAILLTGGSSRIPRIAQILSETFDLPTAVDADPKAIIALGAARSAVAVPTLEVADEADIVDDDDTDEIGAFLPEPTDVPRRRPWFRRLPTTAAIAGGALVLAGGLVVSGASALGSLEAPRTVEFDDPIRALQAADADTDETDAAAAPTSAPVAAPATQADAAEPDTKPSANPRAPKKSTTAESKPKNSSSPSGSTNSGSTPSGSNGSGSAPSGSNGSSNGSSTPSTPSTDTGTQNPSTPAPEPSTPPPAEPTPTPEPSSPPPAEPTPTPEPTTPAPEPTSTTPDPAPAPSESSSAPPADSGGATA